MRSRGICERGGSRGFFLPVTDGEADLDEGLRAAIYAIFMVYSFLGVSIAADIFMSSIEAITSRRRQRKLRDGRYVTYKVWNETVANLSLMALGSSAPEIFLSVIDLLRNEFHAGDLGPSTIVGSAAFNLFVIVAVCMLAIPNGDGRCVEQVPVFIVTAIFSLLAYVWLVIVVSVISPNIVSIWEAALTFAFLPMLIFLSWKVDINGFPGLLPSGLRPSITEKAEMEETSSASLGTEDRRAQSQSKRQSIATDMSRGNYDAKHLLIQRLTAGRGATRVSRNWGAYSGASFLRSTTTSQVSSDSAQSRCVQFAVDFQCMSKDLESKPVWLSRQGDLTEELRVEYSVYAFTAPITIPKLVRTAPQASKQWFPLLTEDGEKMGSFKEREKVLVKDDEVVFGPSEDQKEVLIQQPTVTGCEDFALQLSAAETASNVHVHLGPLTYTRVKSVPSGSPGKVRFACERVGVTGTQMNKSITVLVLRANGCSGHARCNFRTEALSALPDIHYTPSEGQIDFADGVTEAFIELEILPVAANRHPKQFVVILDEADSEAPATFDPNCDGGEDCTILTVSIEMPGSSKFWKWLDWLVNLDSVHLGNSDWFNNATSVFFVGGSLEEQRAAGCIDWVFHIIALPWKVFFIFVPSVYYLGGWVCFIMSLVYIALLTGVIADLADLFGCVLEIRDMVTAITFVALGTSMPDLFASKGAAMEDPTADASIVNVTGSNSVNVFLGLGLPWTCGAIYWELQGRTSEWEERYGDSVGADIAGVAFVVEGRDLGFNVLIFSVCCIVGLTILGLKRYVTGVELGGPVGVKYSVAGLFFLLWIAYILLASWRVLRVSPSSSEEMGVLLGTTGVVAFFCAVAVGFMMQHSRNRPATPKEVEPAANFEKASPREMADVACGEKPEVEEGPGEEGSVDIKPPLVAIEVPSGSRGRCFSKA